MARKSQVMTSFLIGFMIFSLFSCTGRNLPTPPTPPATSNSVELLDFVFREVSRIIKPGVTTQQIEHYVSNMLQSTNATLYFKGYRDYPNIITLSVNDEVISAPPSKRRLKGGDILKMEFGLALDGKHAVTEWTFPVGKISAEDDKLLKGTFEALEAGIKQVRAGMLVSAVSYAIEKKLTSAGLSPNRDFVGYQIGAQAHMLPAIPCYVDPSSPLQSGNPELSEGMTLAIIVIAHQGSPVCYIDQDGWTLKSQDGRKAACFSRMVEVTKDGSKILTNEPQFQ